MDDAVRLRPLSLVKEGDEILVGDPATGTFVAMPEVGGVVIEALRRGASAAEAAREAEDFAGEPVDIPEFVETLRELGFLETEVVEREAEARRSAPIQARGWLRGVRPELARPLFGRVAWTFYALCVVVDVVMIAWSPSLWPRPGRDAFVFDDIGLSILALYPFALAVMAVHECWHWLAARAAGVPARFGVDRRVVFLVFETDLSQLWTLPRRRRLGPLLAGMAIDSVVLCCVLVVRQNAGGGELDALMAAWAFFLVSQLAWQCMVFLRTDLYAVLVTLTGCRNLWRVKTLMLRSTFGRLNAAETEELNAAAAADLRVGRWFRWLWVAGFLVVAAWVVAFPLPTIPPVFHWAVDGLSGSPGGWTFWSALGGSLVFFGPWVFVLALASLDLLRHDRLRTGTAFERRSP
ncbi:hypothetical protein J4573_09050 [Actinomadura barringtoniae]|uniref:PqqD family protein n=1 Tax=Actinomadura barringtoniae TaxID=1427535 RepID=A0A939P7S0_9ACTN|nr:hypothetical protein [Actinomadura barringtoniae]MBO2447230.1 hypothetical protein [Actinomadura barringtoniae]